MLRDVETFDVVKHSAPVWQEALHRGAISEIAQTAHRASDVVSGRDALEPFAGALAFLARCSAG